MATEVRQFQFWDCEPRQFDFRNPGAPAVTNTHTTVVEALRMFLWISENDIPPVATTMSTLTPPPAPVSYFHLLFRRYDIRPLSSASRYVRDGRFIIPHTIATAPMKAKTIVESQIAAKTFIVALPSGSSAWYRTSTR